MNRIIKYSIALTVLICFSNSTKAGGGWTLKKNEVYIKVSEWWVVADEHFVRDGLKDPNVTTGIFTTALYAEYGISDRFTGILYAPFFSRNYQNNQVSEVTGDILVKGEAINSVGDFNIGIKYGILKKDSKVKLAATANFGLAFGAEQGGSLKSLQTGDGEYNQILRLDLGVPFRIGKISMYSNFYSAFNNRTENFSDEFRFGAEVGAGLLKKTLWLNAKINGIESLQNGSLDGSTSTGVFANNSEILSYSVGAAYYVTKRFGISAEYTVPISGEITFSAPSYSAGLFWDLKQSNKPSRKKTIVE